MKWKTGLFELGAAVAICLAITMCTVRPAAGQDQAALEKAELNMLRSMVKSQAEQIEKLKAQNAVLAEQVRRLEELCAKAGIATSQPAAGPTTAPATPGTYTYNGRPRTQAWFDEMHKKFAGRIACVDGKYFDVRDYDEIAKRLKVGSMDELNYMLRGRVDLEWPIIYPASDNTIGQTPRRCRVMQVLGKDELLAYVPATPDTKEFLYHVKGMDTKGLVDNAEFYAKLMRVGTYRYVAISGAVKTIASFVVYTPLTKEQFADALAKGFKLVEYRTIEVKSKDEVMKTKLVPMPVP